MPLIPKDNLLPVRPWNWKSRQLILSKQDVESEANIDHGKIDLTEPISWIYRALGYKLKDEGLDERGRKKYVIEAEGKRRAEPVPPPAPIGKYAVRTEADPVISEDYGSLRDLLSGLGIDTSNIDEMKYKKHNDTISELLKSYNIERNGADEFELAYKDLLSDVRKDGNVVNFRSENDMRSRHGTIGIEYVNNNVIEMAGGLTYEKALDVLAHEYAAKLLRKKKPDFDHTKNEVLVTELGVAITKEYVDKALSALKN